MTAGCVAIEPLVHINDFRMDFEETTVIKDPSFDRAMAPASLTCRNFEPGTDGRNNMKWYRYVHSILFVASFLPSLFSFMPFWQGVQLPLLMIVPYAINELVIARRETARQIGLSGAAR